MKKLAVPFILLFLILKLPFEISKGKKKKTRNQIKKY